MNTLAQIPQAGFALTALNGAERGVTYQLVAGRATIGRSSDNNIVIKDDPKISRNHALITVTANGAEISDVSDRNKVIVGDEEVTRRVLRSGDIIQLGNTKFQFKVLSQASDIELLNRVMAKQGIESDPNLSKKSSGRKRSPQGNLNFKIMIVAVILLFAWLLSSNSTKKADVKIRTDDDLQSDLTTNSDLIKSLNDEKNKSGKNTKQYEEAQTFFIKGFRDYRKGQYARAKEAFQTCQTLFSGHAQCNRYYDLSEKKFYELIQYHMVQANKYRAQNQFNACKSSFRNAMVMIQNPDDKIYKEAKSGFEVCKELEGDRF